MAAPEVFLEVLEYLEQADLASLALTCKSIHSLAQRHLYRHISLRNDKDALQLIRTHQLADRDVSKHVTHETRSLIAGNIGKVKLLTILKACSCRLDHLTINCRLLTLPDQLEICDCISRCQLAIRSIHLRDPQPQLVDCLWRKHKHSLRSVQVV